MALRSFKVAYAYDAAGRIVREGGKTYRYGYLDKVLSVTDGERRYAYDYHADGQLARASYGSCGRPGCPQPAATETFDWDGLALVRRGDEHFLNEPHVGGGNPVTSSKGTSFFNDMLGTTVGIWEGRASARPNSGRKYAAAALTAFGETIENESCHSPTPTHNSNSFYTGKPHVAGLGHVFLFRNYRASLAKWQTADPLGYPDGWNQLAYCNNGVTGAVDLWGCEIVFPDQSNIQWARFNELVFGISVSWDCSHDFYSPHFSCHTSTSGDTGEIVIDYKGDHAAVMMFSKVKTKDTATYLSKISTSFDHAWQLLVEFEVYVTITYLDSHDCIQVDQYLNRRLTFDTVHWIHGTAE